MASIAGGVIDEVDEVDEDSLKSPLSARPRHGGSGNGGRAQQQEARGTPQDDNDDEAEWIYVLELEDGCFYVGKTSNPDARLEQHRNLGRYTGAAWTRLHPPTTTGYLVCRQVKKEYSGLEEDALTQMWMMKKGIDKVRGGSYSQCVLPGHQLKTLQQAAWHCMGACTGCGADDHWVEQCDQKRAFGVNETGGGGNGSADGLETRIDHRRKGSGVGAEETSAPALRSEEPFSFPSAKSFGASNSFGAPAAAVSFGGAPAAATSFGGAPAAATSFGGSFCAPPAATSFGAPATATGFGGDNTGFGGGGNTGFGGAPTNNATTNPFGGEAATTGFGGGNTGFGGAPQTNTGFGGGGAAATSFGASFGAPAAAVSFGAPAAASSGGNGGSQFDNGGGGVGSTEHKEAKKTTTKKTGARYKVIKVQVEGLISKPDVLAQAAVKLYNEAWKCEPTPHGATASTALTKCAEALTQQVQEAVEEGYFPCGAATHVTIKHQRHHDGSGMTSYQHFMTQAMLKQATLPVAPVETFLF